MIHFQSLATYCLPTGRRRPNATHFDHSSQPNALVSMWRYSLSGGRLANKKPTRRASEQLFKRDDLFAAIVPTDAPQWADRAGVAAALVAGIGGVVVALVRLFPAAPGTKSVATATSSV